MFHSIKKAFSNLFNSKTSAPATNAYQFYAELAESRPKGSFCTEIWNFPTDSTELYEDVTSVTYSGGGDFFQGPQPVVAHHTTERQNFTEHKTRYWQAEARPVDGQPEQFTLAGYQCDETVLSGARASSSISWKEEIVDGTVTKEEAVKRMREWLQYMNKNGAVVSDFGTLATPKDSPPPTPQGSTNPPQKPILPPLDLHRDCNFFNPCRH